MIRKGLRKNSEIFVNLRKSSGQSMRERSDRRRWCSRVFLAVLRVFQGIMGCSGYYGLFLGCSGVVPGCSGGVPGMFQVFRGCSWFYRHPMCSYTSEQKLDLRKCTATLQSATDLPKAQIEMHKPFKMATERTLSFTLIR